MIHSKGIHRHTPAVEVGRRACIAYDVKVFLSEVEMGHRAGIAYDLKVFLPAVEACVIQ